MTTSRPLAGITVLEIGHSIAGPFAGMILGELGADVVKVEQPGSGDYCRDWGPPFLDGAALTFHAVNRAKRGITVNLKDPAEVARLRGFILDHADVVVQNLKFGALDALGLTAAELTAAKPSLVYCNLGAFGAKGPLRELPGYDPLMQAHSGLMSLMGEDGRPPVRVGVSIIDLSTGMWAAIGILAALQERARTGRGGIVDTSLYESALSWLCIQIGMYLYDHHMPKREGSGTAQIVPYQAFRTSDGWIMVLAGNDNFFRRLCEALACPELASDERFRTNGNRVVNRTVLIPILQEIMAREPTASWVEKLSQVKVPHGPIQNIGQVVEDPQTLALDMIQVSPDGLLRLVGMPLAFDGERPAFVRRPPGLGEHNDEVLGS